MTRRLAAIPLLIVAALVLAAPASAAQPIFNPSTGTIWTAPPFGAYKDTTFIFASGDTADWSPGFVFNNYCVITFTKGIFAQIVGKSTLTPASTRSKIPVGYGKNHPIFNSSEWFIPAQSTHSLPIPEARGFSFRSTSAADTVIVICWRS